MISYQYRKYHCGGKTILRPSYLHNKISYTGKMTSLYWIRAQGLVNKIYIAVMLHEWHSAASKARITGPVVMGIHQWLVVSHHKRLAMRKSFPFIASSWFNLNCVIFTDIAYMYDTTSSASLDHYIRLPAMVTSYSFRLRTCGDGEIKLYRQGSQQFLYKIILGRESSIALGNIWRPDQETQSSLLSLYEGVQRIPLTKGQWYRFVTFYRNLNKLLNTQTRCRWF